MLFYGDNMGDSGLSETTKADQMTRLEVLGVHSMITTSA